LKWALTLLWYAQGGVLSSPGGGKIAEYEGKGQKTQAAVDQKQLVKQHKSQPLLEKFQEWDTGAYSIAEPTFQPRMEQHAALLASAHSDSVRANLALQLQQTYGNRYVQRLVESVGAQAKLTVNAPNDVYEQEADRVAEAVNSTIAPSVQWQKEEEEELQTKPLLQRQEEEEEFAMKLASQVQHQAEEGEGEVHTMLLCQRQDPEREEEKLQMKLNTRQVGQEGSQVDPEVESALQEVRYGGQPIDGKVQRMVVAATDNIDNVTDPLVWNNLEHAQTQAGGPVGDLKTNLVWSQLKRGEEVRIVGHGTETTGELSAAKELHDAKDIKDSMVADGLNAPNAPKLSKLIFQSCFAGKKLQIGQNLIQEMTAALTDIGQSNVDVYGRPGIAFGFKGMGGKTAKSEKVYSETMEVMQSRNPQTKGGVYIFKAKDTYNDPWMIVKTSKRKWETWPIDKKMNEVANQMEEYWRDFNTEMEKRKGFLKPGQEIEKVVSK